MEGSCEYSDVCGRDALDGHDGRCILHSEKSEKDEATFKEELEAHWEEHGTDFRKMVFPIEFDFTGEPFEEGADFTDAVFEEGADFSGAEFGKEIDFSGADLSGVDFSDTDLSHANMARADLTGATLPGDTAEFEGLDRVEQATKYARRLFFMVLTACVYSWLAVGTTSDIDLFADATTTPLPFIGTGISIVGFYRIAPIGLFVLFVYYHLQLQRLWEEVARLPSRFPDGQPLDRKTAPWLLLGLSRSHVAHLNEQQLPFFWLQRYVAHLVAWWMVPTTLVLFGVRYMVGSDPYGTAIHCITATAGVWFAYAFHQKARATLCGRSERPFTWWRDLRVGRRVAAGSFVVFAALFFFGKRADSTFTRPQLTGADLRGVDLEIEFSGKIKSAGAYLVGGQFNRAKLNRSNLAGAKLQDANFINAELDSANLKGANLDSSDFERAHLRHTDLSDTNLRGADLPHADLSHAELDSTNLSGAVLPGANLLHAELDSTNLSKAVLRRDTLSGADLDSVDLSGADLSRADLRGAEFSSSDTSFASSTDLDTVDLLGARLDSADFRHSNLSDANLSRTDLSAEIRLDGAKLDGANLRFANLDSVMLRDAKLPDAKLQSADLVEAKLNGANLDGAKLVDANLRGAELIEADLVKAILLKADLSGATLYRANLSEADLGSANIRGVQVVSDSLFCSTATLKKAKLSLSLVASVCRMCPEKFGPPEIYEDRDPRRCGR